MPCAILKFAGLAIYWVAKAALGRVAPDAVDVHRIADAAAEVDHARRVGQAGQRLGGRLRLELGQVLKPPWRAILTEMPRGRAPKRGRGCVPPPPAACGGLRLAGQRDLGAGGRVAVTTTVAWRARAGSRPGRGEGLALK